MWEMLVYSSGAKLTIESKREKTLLFLYQKKIYGPQRHYFDFKKMFCNFMIQIRSETDQQTV